MKLKKDLKQYLILFLVALVAIVAECYPLLAEANALTGKQPYTKLFFLTADCLALLLPYWLLTRGWRRLVLIPVWLLALWFIGSIWYFRFWLELPDVSALLLFDNLNGELFKSTLGLWRPTDLLILLIPAGATAAYHLWLKKGAESYYLPIKPKIAAVAATLMLSATTFVGYTLVLGRFLKSESVEMNFGAATSFRLAHANISPIDSMRQNGILAHFIYSTIYLYDVLTVNHKLSDSENAAITEFINSSHFPNVLPDSIKNENSRKNVVLIVVESLNSSAINAEVNGQKVAPTLAQLSESDSTVSALNVKTEVRQGGSGDGQIILNTGLLPLPRFSTSILLGSKNTFPSLARMLNRKSSLVIFADANQSWNETGTFNNLGFDRNMCNKEYPELLHRLGSDAAMFAMADSMISTLREPFFLELLTTSMHIPFDDPEVPESMKPNWINNDNVNHPMVVNYFRMVHYFDTALAQFIEALKLRGLYENTMIFIVSDHSQDILHESDAQPESMVFIGANTGISQKINRRVNQTDVFPTILQLAGANDSIAWKGVGNSMLAPADNRPELADKISQLILRGDFFQRKICSE